METKRNVQVLTVTPAPNTGRDAPASTGRQWESFPQPAGWSLHWDNEGLLFADPEGLPSAGPEDSDTADEQD